MIINDDDLSRAAHILQSQVRQTFTQIIWTIQRRHNNGDGNVRRQAATLIAAAFHFVTDERVRRCQTCPEVFRPLQ